MRVLYPQTSQVQSCPSVLDALVVHVPPNETRAFVVTTDPTKPLQLPLPHPHTLVQITHIPLSPDGLPNLPALAQLKPLPQGAPPTSDQAQRLEAAPQPPRPHLHLQTPPTTPRPKSQSQSQSQSQPNTAAANPSVLHGQPLRATGPRNAVEILEAARRRPQAGLLLIDDDGARHRISYDQLFAEARAVAQLLAERGCIAGDPVVLPLPRPRLFLPALWGCILGGHVAVPAADPQSGHAAAQRLQQIMDVLDQPAVLSAPDLHGLLGARPRIAAPGQPPPPIHNPSNEETALLLFTSGSTGQPKGVPLTHANLIAMIRGTTQLLGFTHRDITLNWMPLDHVGAVVFLGLLPAFLGADQIHVPTQTIMADPLIWLDLIHQQRASISWAPNFAFALVNQAVAHQPPQRWDLSCLTHLTNAGEANTTQSMDRFLALLADWGLPPNAVHPAFGMSECCSGITFSTTGYTPGHKGMVPLGPPIAGAALRVVDPHNQPVPMGGRGRLQLKGPSVFSGYFQNPRADPFTPDGWLDTGDLAVILHGELRVAGRAKDDMVINGVNIPAHLIEEAVDALPGVAVSWTCATPAHTIHDQTERVVVFFVPDFPGQAMVPGLIRTIRAHLAGHLQVNPDVLLPLKRNQIPRTGIGKIQRAQLRAQFEAGRFDHLLLQHGMQPAAAGIPDRFHVPAFQPRALPPNFPQTQPEAEAEPQTLPHRQVLRLSPTSTFEAAAQTLLDTARALLARNQPAQLMVITHHTAGAGLSGLAALCRAVTAEHPRLHCRLLDLDHNPDDTLIQREWTAHDIHVRYRRGQRLTPALIKTTPDQGPDPLKPGGLYGITGGLGGVAQEVAELLLDLSAHLLLIGRSAAPANHPLLTHPAVTYARLDVADTAALHHHVTQFEHQHQRPLDGVFHLAGLAGVQALMDADPESLTATLHAKVAGTRALTTLWDTRPHLLLTAFSSVLGFHGGANLTAYSAANAFMDNALQDWADKGYKVKILSWSQWTGQGMSADQNHDRAVRAQGYHGIPPREGRLALRYALRAPDTHLYYGMDEHHPRIRVHAAGPAHHALQLTRYTTTRPQHPSPADVWVDPQRAPRDDHGHLDPDALARALRSGFRTAQAHTPHHPLLNDLLPLWRQTLAVDQVHPDDDFFELGGNSLKATVLLTAVKSRFHISLSPRVLFEAGTPAALAQHLAQACQPSSPANDEPAVHDGPPVLSSAQAGQWFIHTLTQGDPVYHLHAVWRLNGPLDADRLNQNLTDLAQRHPSLRTYFPAEEGQPHPRLADVFAGLERVDLSQTHEEPWQDILLRRIRQPMNLAQAPPFFAVLYTLGHHQHLLLLIFHHIIADDWSLRLLINELNLRNANPNHTTLPPPPQTYLDYARHQAAQAPNPDAEHQLHQRLSGIPTRLTLPRDLPPVTPIGLQGKRLYFQLRPTLLTRLDALAARSGVTRFMILEGVFALLLGRLTGEDHLLVGVPAATRNHPRLQDLLGMFVNTVVLDHHLTPHADVPAYLTQVKTSALSAFEHADIPFERVVELLHPQRESNGLPLVQVMFNYRNEPLPHLILDGLEGQWEELDPGVARFELSLEFQTQTHGLAGFLEYNTRLFSDAGAARRLHYYKNLLDAALTHPHLPPTRLPMLCPLERATILQDWSGSTQPFPTRHLSQWIRQTAERRPHAVALIQLSPNGARHITYSQLIDRADAWSATLARHGLQVGDTVGACLDRNLDLPAALLGAATLGVTFIPLDPAFPAQRLDDIRRQAHVRVWLGVTGPNNITRIHPQDVHPGPFPKPHIPPELPVYTLFTSGSTGRPKGCVITHAAFANQLQLLHHAGLMHPTDTFAALSTPAFDIAMVELFLPLAVGGRLLLGDRAYTTDGARLQQAVTDHHVTLVQGTPSTWDLLLQTGFQGRPQLRIWSAGEALPRNLTHRLLAANHAVINLYGPTEACVYTTAYTRQTPFQSKDGPPVSLGKPLANYRVLVLDRRLQAVPAGVVGQLFVAGVALSPGYLNRPDLTAAAFLPNPFATQPGDRLYATGDLVTRDQQGRLHILGRADHQLKIRGYRIEPGEIETRLQAHPSVEKALVIPRQIHGDTALTAYVIPTDHAAPNSQTLRDHLSTQLPAYMVPAHIVWMDDFPLTPNRKIDRNALPLPDQPVERTGDDDLRGDVERLIGAVWRRILGVAAVNRDDHFFELGGHSLLAARVLAELPAGLKRDLTMADLFNHPTPATLAERLAGHHPSPSPPPPAPSTLSQEIAVIAMALRVPGADQPAEFYHNLYHGRISLTRHTWSQLALTPTPEEVPVRGALTGVFDFDADFFAMSPKEVLLTDPQHRLFLELCWEALMRAGYDADTYPGRIGVYAGCGVNFYQLNHLAPRQDLLQDQGLYAAMIGAEKDFLCTRIAYKLGLTGPAVTLQTACSTSLTAVITAVQALQAGACDLALAGGVSLGPLHPCGYRYTPGMIFSPDGACRPFDARAAGIVPGQGAGVVVLRRGGECGADTVLGMIKGGAVTNDGARKAGFTAPGGSGQAQTLQLALQNAGVEPHQIRYVETHGTGTPVGDPIEYQALKQVYGGAKLPPCALGSVKADIGHLDTASGVVGLIKTLLFLRAGVIPPMAGFQTPHPDLNLTADRFTIPVQAAPFEPGPPPLAAVSSFGIGGTNAHLIVSPPPERPAPAPAAPGFILPLSAPTPTRLDRLTDHLVAHLEQIDDDAVADLAYTLQVGRPSLRYRRVWLAASRAEALLEGARREPGRVMDREATVQHRPVVFMFPGQGSQYAGMGTQLAASDPWFEEQRRQVLTVLRRVHPKGLDLNTAPDRPHQTRWTQPALFVLEYILAQYWRRLGVTPVAMAGHSLGEITAACLAGVFTLEEALYLVSIRAQAMDQAPPGAMLAVNTSLKGIQPYLCADTHPAAVNGPDRLVIAGPNDAVQRLSADLKAAQIPTRRLNVSHAFHTPMLRSAREPLKAAFQHIHPKPPNLPVTSNVTGAWLTAQQAVSPDYWADQMTQPVQFQQNLMLLAQIPNALPLEVGPGRTLSTLAAATPAFTHPPLAALPHPHDDHNEGERLRRAVAKLWLAGVDLNWDALHTGAGRRRADVPFPPLERRTYHLPPTGLVRGYTHFQEAAPSPPGDQASAPPPPPPQPQPQPQPIAGPDDPLETQIQAAFAQALGRPELGVHDDFFDLGGDSLLALNLLDQLRQSLHLPLGQHLLLRFPTPAALAQHLREAGSVAEDLGPLVQIQAGGGEPLFLVHPIGGEVYFYRDLAHHLGSGRAVYAFRAPSLTGDGPPMDHLETQADAYLDALQRHFPRASYRLGGASYGGLVAYEMARRLRERGGRVALLVMMDTPGPGKMPRRLNDSADILNFLLGDTLDLELETLRRLDEDEQIAHIQRLTDHRHAALIPHDMTRYMFATWRAHQEAMFNYRPQPYAGRVLYFQHTQPMTGFPAHPYQGWDALLTGPRGVFPVPGTHITMNFNPLVKHIADLLKEIEALGDRT